jgi:hypothetical protein
MDISRQRVAVALLGGLAIWIAMVAVLSPFDRGHARLWLNRALGSRVLSRIISGI